MRTTLVAATLLALASTSAGDLPMLERARAVAGESPATLEKGATVGSGAGREYRYMKALPTQELCLACHGTAERIDPAVRARLAELYPGDHATGYRPGEIRGALTLRRPLPAQ